MENIPNAANKNEEAERICMSVVHKTLTWPEQLQPPILNTHNSFLPITPYTHYYQQYLNQFVPYYYNLYSNPINYNLGYSHTPRMANEMGIEKYINYEVTRQQNLMKKAHIPPPRPALVPIQVPISRKMPLRKTHQEKRILNVQVVAMATNPRDKKPTVEPLPPVEASFKEQVAKINKSQQHYMQLFGRLTSMLQTLNQRYDGHEQEPEEEEQPENAPPPPLKRPRHESSSSSTCSSSHLDAEIAHNPHSHYPQRIQQEDGSFSYVLGPNGTQITAQQYGNIFWTDAPVATRTLLSVVFSSDELATHTLTGKPSPAFYGRERPAKKMLDQGRVDDIVVSVRNRTGGKERNIRATITTKCADTAKKYKRRAKKASKGNPLIKDD